jgi:hypothetical protein
VTTTKPSLFYGNHKLWVILKESFLGFGEAAAPTIGHPDTETKLVLWQPQALDSTSIGHPDTETKLVLWQPQALDSILLKQSFRGFGGAAAPTLGHPDAET